MQIDITPSSRCTGVVRKRLDQEAAGSVNSWFVPPVVAIQAFATPALVSVEHVEGVETHALLTVPVADAIYLHHVSPLVGATSLHLPVSEGFCSEVYATSLDLAILQLPLFLGLLRA